MQIFGWLSSLMFMICGIPQAYKCYKEGNAKGMSSTFIITWLLGEIFGVIYISDLEPYPWPLLFNYAVSIISTTIIISYFISPRDKNGKSRKTKDVKNIQVLQRRRK